MNVLINGSAYNSNPSGIGIYIREVCHTLHTQRDKEINFTFISFLARPTIDMPSLTIRPHPLLFILCLRKIELYRFFWNLFILPGLAKNYDLVYSPSTHGTILSSRQVITVHDLISLHYPSQYLLQYLYFRWYVPALLKKAKKIVCISDFTKNDVLTYYKVPADKLVVIHNGVDHSVTYQSGNTEDFEHLKSNYGFKAYCLVVGASFPHKNLETLVELYHENKIALDLLVVGTVNAYLHKVRQKVAALGIPNIHFLGYVGDDTLQVLYKNAEFNIYISLYEGFGFPPLEALRWGTPSIVSIKGAIPEICGPTALYVDPLDKNELYRIMLRLTGNRTLREELVAHIPDHLNHFKWVYFARDLSEVLRRL